MSRALSDDLRSRVLAASADGDVCTLGGSAVWNWDFDGHCLDR